MASVILENIPQGLLDLLEQKARLHAHTLQEEILQVLQEAVNSDQEAPSMLDALEAFRQQYHQGAGQEPYVDPFEGVRAMRGPSRGLSS